LIGGLKCILVNAQGQGRNELRASTLRHFRAAPAIGNSVREIDGRAESCGDRELQGQRAARVESREGREPRRQLKLVQPVYHCIPSSQFFFWLLCRHTASPPSTAGMHEGGVQ